MEFGEQIQLNEAEQEALRFGDVPLRAEWPATKTSCCKLSELIVERLVDKRGLLDEIRQRGMLRRSPPVAFRLRREIGILHEAHELLFDFAVERGYSLPESDK